MAARAASLGAEVVFIASVPPQATDDGATIGAREGNRWHDQSADQFWLCSSSATGAAIWLPLARSGSGDADRVPLAAFLGSAAFVSADLLRARYLGQHDAAYQIVPADWGRLLLCTAGTRTWTLPSYLDVDTGWWASFKVRATAVVNLTPTGAELLNGANAAATLTGVTSGVVTMTSAGFETH